LLPGRGPAGRPPGRDAPWPPARGPLGRPPWPGAAGRAGRGPGVAPGLGPAGAAGGAWNSGAAGAGAGGWTGAGLGAGAFGPGAGRGPGAGTAEGVLILGAASTGLGPGFGAAAGRGAAPGTGADGLTGAALRGADGLPTARPAARPAPLPWKASVNLRTTGASMVEDAERTNSPSSWSLAMTTLLSTPNSLASSYTRTLATSLLLVRGGRPPDLRYFMGVLIAYSSSAHRNLDLLPTREVPDRTVSRAVLLRCRRCGV
jgi:hypothetical protein